MTILITGAAGFVGRTLVKLLLQSGRSVKAVDINLSGFDGADGLESVEGDLSDSGFRASLFTPDVEKIVHLAALPGGAAEQDPDLSFQINTVASYDLMKLAGKSKPGMRFVFSSTIGVLMHPQPKDGVNDDTPRIPWMHYGMHKLMTEAAIATLTLREMIDGVGVRLPGVVARPQGAKGLKSAFMNDIFHVLNDGGAMTLPVSPDATIWLMSCEQVAKNLIHALDLDSSTMPASRVVTLPAIRVQMDELVARISSICGTSADGITYDVDEELNEVFGSQPPLFTPNADHAGFLDDGSLDQLVKNVLAGINSAGNS